MPVRAGRPCKMIKLARAKLQFFPARYAKTFQSWHENIRDWCISRQLWWGHRIPVWHLRAVITKKTAWEELTCRGIDHALLGETPGVAVAVKNVATGQQIDVSDHRRFDSGEFEGEFDIFLCILNDQYTTYYEDYGFTQDPDVLDTWFSSALWPISTMGWPDPAAFPETVGLLDTFNPSSVLCTGRDIITLWVSRMVMFNRYFREGKLPFRHVYINPMIQDGHGQRMSKSLGNGVDPRDIIYSHGADALRFTLVQIATSTQDVRLPVDMICPHPGCGETFHPKEVTSPAGYRVAAPEQECPRCKKKMISGYGAASGLATPTKEVPLARNSSTKFDQGRNFANKLWNATRFALSNLSASKTHAVDGVGFDSARELALVDRWIISRLHRTLHTVEDALREYQFNIYADAMYDLVWRDFCDWYLEAIKPTVKASPAQQQVLSTVLNAIMRLLHPIMPFVTEALWPSLAPPPPESPPETPETASDMLKESIWNPASCWPPPLGPTSSAAWMIPRRSPPLSGFKDLSTPSARSGPNARFRPERRSACRHRATSSSWPIPPAAWWKRLPGWRRLSRSPWALDPPARSRCRLKAVS